MNDQMWAALQRAGIMLGSIIVAGLVPLYPQIIGNTPLDKDAMIRAFIGGVVGALISRVGEGAYDGNRAAQVRAGNLSALSRADVGATLAPTEKQP